METSSGRRNAFVLAPGDRVGNYLVRGIVGKGGWGTVYVAEHPAIGSKVAIKVLRGDLCDTEDALSRFFNEAKAANAIKSDHVVEVMDFGQTAAGQPYFIMEWLVGRSLGTLIQHEGALAVPRAVRIARQTARALAAAHRAGVIHRDLKPDNIFLERRERDPEFVKLLDFGIAKIVGGETAHRTTTGQALGTPYYMSPEQCEGTRALDARSDLYALGIILYEMVTGQKPFRSEGVGALIIQQMTQPPPAPSALAPSIPPALERTILHLLEKDPERRPASAADVLAVLDGLLLGSGDDATVPVESPPLLETPLVVPAPRPSPRRAWWPYAVGAGALLAGLAALWLLGRAAPPPPPPAGGAPAPAMPAAPPPAPPVRPTAVAEEPPRRPPRRAAVRRERPARPGPATPAPAAAPAPRPEPPRAGLRDKPVFLDREE